MTRRTARLDLRQAGKQIFVALGVLAALNAVFYLTLAQPTVREYRRLNEEEKPFRRLAERREIVETHETFRGAAVQAGTDLSVLKEDILSSRNQRLVAVQEELAALCERFGIDFESVSYDTEFLLDEELDRLTMNVPLKGNYANLRDFVRAVEQSDEFLVIERVSLARGKEGGRLLDLNIALATYFTLPADVLERKRALTRRRGG